MLLCLLKLSGVEELIQFTLSQNKLKLAANPPGANESLEILPPYCLVSKELAAQNQMGLRTEAKMRWKSGKKNLIMSFNGINENSLEVDFLSENATQIFSWFKIHNFTLDYENKSYSTVAKKSDYNWWNLFTYINDFF